MSQRECLRQKKESRLLQKKKCKAEPSDHERRKRKGQVGCHSGQGELVHLRPSMAVKSGSTRQENVIRRDAQGRQNSHAVHTSLAKAKAMSPIDMSMLSFSAEK